MIRRGTLDDLPSLLAGNQALARETEDLELDAAVLRSGLQAVLSGQVPGHYYVLEREADFAAQLMITYEWSDWRNGVIWWIQSVYVWPAFREQGCFADLYRHVRVESETAGAVGLRLYVDARNTRAQSVYARVGMNGEHYRVFEDMF